MAEEPTGVEQSDEAVRYRKIKLLLGSLEQPFALRLIEHDVRLTNCQLEGWIDDAALITCDLGILLVPWRSVIYVLIENIPPLVQTGPGLY
jgi:hypothetical protein